MSQRIVPLALIVLSLIPVISGSLRLVEIAGGPQLMPTNPRIDASPAPLVVHVLGAAVYALLGAFQFSARLRRRHLNWHRKSGRVLVGAGMAASIVLGFAWVINAAVAEWVIRRPSVRRARRVRVRAALAGS